MKDKKKYLLEIVDHSTGQIVNGYTGNKWDILTALRSVLKLLKENQGITITEYNR